MLHAQIDRWRELKRIEAEAAAERKEIEDAIAAEMRRAGHEIGEKPIKVTDDVKVSIKLTRKVDYNKLLRIGDERGIPSTELLRLFRFGAEMNVKEFKACTASWKDALLGAVTTTESRPYFQLVKGGNSAAEE